MKKIKNKNFLLFCAILLLGIILRFYLLGSLPTSLNVDEAALGYNSYSILKTGSDEHGKFLPLTLESFGDWKLPGYVYIGVPLIAIFGLSEFATRLPSALAGVASIILIYFIAQILIRKKAVSLLAALFIAVSPWSVYFSRAAYEVNLATTFFLGGLLMFLVALHHTKARFFLLCSAFLFGFTIFTYHSYIIFMPLFLAFLLFLYRSHFLKNKKNAVLFIVISSIFLLVSLYSNITVSTSKLTTTTVFNNKNVLYNRVENIRGDSSPEQQLFKRIHTKYLGVPYQVAQNYVSSFSPSFLFDRGGEKLVHNLNGFGNLYLFDALLLIAGFAGLFYMREKSIPLLLGWLMLAPIPSALTLDSPNTTRLYLLMPLFILVEAYGAYMFVKMLNWGILKILLVVLVMLYILNFVFFLDSYFVHFNVQRVKFWRYGNKEVVEVTNKYPEKKVVTQGVYDYPYIYFLFYNKYDPKKFRNEVAYYPVSYDGLSYVKNFGRYRFVHALSDEIEEKGAIYIDNQNFNIGDNLILLPNGDPVFKYYFGK